LFWRPILARGLQGIDLATGRFYQAGRASVAGLARCAMLDGSFVSEVLKV